MSSKSDRLGNAPVLILVVEDGPLISAVVEDSLLDGGFLVEEASSWREAMALLDDRAEEFRAIVTDVELSPGPITGWDIAQHARRQKPKLPVVFMTGGSAPEWTAQDDPFSILITKPFAPTQVVNAVTQLLKMTG